MSRGPGPAPRVRFTEVGPRDGLQNLSQPLATERKLELVKGALAAGCDLVEPTSMVSPKWVPQLADAEELLRRLLAEDPDRADRLRVLVPNLKGLERALAAGARRVIVNVGVTDGFNRHNLNRSVEETLGEIARVAEAAARTGCPWDASLSVAFGCPYEGRVEPREVAHLAARLAGLGAGELSLADTIGVAGPSEIEAVVELVAERVPRERLSLHLHDTRGMGLANALTGYRLGISRFEGSVGGIGGCPFAPRSTGNVCSEDLLHLLQRLGASGKASVAALCDLAQRLEGWLGHPLPGRLYRAGVWDVEA